MNQAICQTAPHDLFVRKSAENAFGYNWCIVIRTPASTSTAVFGIGVERVKRILLALLIGAGALWGAVPTPEEHFGHRMGAARKLVAWDQVVSYFEALDRESDLIRTETLGRSTEGKPFIAAIISSATTLSDLDRYLEIQQKLADPRGVSPDEVEALVDEGKTVVMITCSIHSTEVASTHTAAEFAHRMITGQGKETKAILENVIFILVPSLNPDGVEIVRQWYEKTLDTPYEGTSPPELYQKYVGHDNNRDWYIFSQAETQIAVSRLHNVWHPQIVYDVHQMGPYGARMFVPPWLDPVDPNIDPMIVQLCNMIGIGMAADLTGAGKKGVVINAIYDFWTPARHYQAYHGGMRILSESASARLATPIDIQPTQIRGEGRGFDPRSRSWNYVEPWLGGGWTVRDIVDYQLIAWESCLYQAAVRRADLLRAFHGIGRRAVKRTSPYAFVVPASQRDPGSARKLMETLAFGMIEVERAGSEFIADGTTFAAGDYVIRMQQPYSSWAKTLLEVQDYPDMRQYPGGPPKRPYDVTAHTLPLLMGVEVATVKDRFEAPLDSAGSFIFDLKGRRPADGGLAASDIDSWKEVNRIWREEGAVWRDELTGDFFARRPDGIDTLEVKAPRVGLYRSWVPSMDEGWTRWTLEQFGFEYTRITNDMVLDGNLQDAFDVIVFPDQSASSLEQGYRRGSMPEEYTGGLNNRAAASLKSFLAGGGTLVFFNRSTEYAINNMGIDASNVVSTLRNSQYYSPGSLLSVRLERHPLTYGLPRNIAIWSQGSPVFAAGRPRQARTVARYPDTDILASGWLLGENHLTGRAALLEVPFGKGRAILFGMRPQYRGQSYDTFKLFFNALTR